MADDTARSTANLEQQRATLEGLRDLLEQTKALYDSAKDAYGKELEEFKKNNRTPPDKVMRAARVREALRENYGNAVKEYNRFILDGYGSTPTLQDLAPHLGSTRF